MIIHLMSHRAVIGLLLGLFTIGLAAAPENNANPAVTSIEGTWKLVSRKLPDGKVLGERDIVGFFTYTKTHRHLNLAYQNSAGKHFSFSSVATYVLTATTYSETILTGVITDEIGGKGTTYVMNASPKSAPVKSAGGRIEIKMPFDPVTSVFEGNVMIGNHQDGFVDRWEKVK